MDILFHNDNSTYSTLECFNDLGLDVILTISFKGILLYV